jgi:hypothetical protein
MGATPPGHHRVVPEPQEASVSTTTTPRRRWRLAAIGLVLAAAPFTATACGSDVVDDDVQQEVEDTVDDAEQEVEDATDGEDSDG